MTRTVRTRVQHATRGRLDRSGRTVKPCYDCTVELYTSIYSYPNYGLKCCGMYVASSGAELGVYLFPVDIHFGTIVKI